MLLRTEPACYFPEASRSRELTNEPPSAKIVEYRDESIVVDTNSPRPSYLVLSESFDLGWHARVDGRPASILEANLYFRSVPLTAGTHRVEFFYLPASYVWGLAHFLAFSDDSCPCRLAFSTTVFGNICHSDPRAQRTRPTAHRVLWLAPH